jgi:hypothetical protein
LFYKKATTAAQQPGYWICQAKKWSQGSVPLRAPDGIPGITRIKKEEIVGIVTAII